jgi:hypothetical protein
MAKLKFFYLNKEDIPAGLVDAYVEKNGRWELEELEDDVPIVQIKQSLERTQTTLKTQVTDAENRATRAEAKAMSAGKVAVDPDVEELGNAAKAAGLKTTELAGFKTKGDELQGKIDELQGKLDAVDYEKTLASVAGDHGLNDKFIELAKDKKLKFESRTEKDEEKNDVTVWDVVSEKDGKTEKQSIGDFIEKNSFFSKFADTFSDSEEGQKTETGTRKWVKSESGKEQKSVPARRKQ